MPYLRAGAPPHIPDHETIESLLGQTDHNRRVRKTKTLQELADKERAKSNLVQLVTWTERIQGDPYGFWHSWAGNIAHTRDERMYDILGPIFDELNATPFAENADLTCLASFLFKVTTTEALALAKESADDQHCNAILAKDLDKNNHSSYAKSKGAQLSAQKIRQALKYTVMSIKEQQYLMAKLIIEKRLELPMIPLVPLRRDQPQSDTSTDSQGRQTLKLLVTLRNMAREHFWHQMDAARREAVRDAVAKEEIDPEFEPGLTVIRANRQKRWNNGKRDPDYHRSCLVDTLAAESVWEMVEEDVVLVLDKNRPRTPTSSKAAPFAPSTSSSSWGSRSLSPCATSSTATSAPVQVKQRIGHPPMRPGDRIPSTLRCINCFLPCHPDCPVILDIIHSGCMLLKLGRSLRNAATGSGWPRRRLCVHTLVAAALGICSSVAGVIFIWPVETEALSRRVNNLYPMRSALDFPPEVN